MFVCLSFIISNGPKSFLQQENVRDIINSRHLAFPVKMADIHQAVKTAEFHIHSGLMLRLFSQHTSLYNSHISSFWILPPQPNPVPHADPQPLQNLLSKPLLPPLPTLSWGTGDSRRGGWNLPGSLRPEEEQWATSTCCGDAGPPPFIVVTTPERVRGPGVTPRPCCWSLMGWPGNCSERGVKARGQIMKNRAKRALESFKEQSLWRHGWVQASSRLSGALAEDC